MRLDGCAYILVHALFYFNSLVNAELLLLRRRRRKEDWVLGRLPHLCLLIPTISLFKCPVESSRAPTSDIYITSSRISTSKELWRLSAHLESPNLQTLTGLVIESQQTKKMSHDPDIKSCSLSHNPIQETPTESET